MRIAQIVTALKDVGAVNVALDIVETMVSHGHYCKVFYFENGGDLVFPCDVERISSIKEIDTNSFDIIHGHCLRPDIFLAKLRLRDRKTILINTIHNYIFPDYRNSMGVFLGTIASVVDLLSMRLMTCNVCLSNDAIKYYKRYLKKKKLRYCYNTKRIQNNPPISELLSSQACRIVDFSTKFKFVCGSICVLSPIKGLDQIIKALKYTPQVGYVIIGDGPSRSELEKLSVYEGVSERVLFTGYVKDAYNLLPYIDVYCMPSISEGFGISLIEAAACGKAILLSDIPIFRELMDSDEAIRFMLGDINDCSNKLLLAYENRVSLGKKAKERFYKDYSQDAFYDKYYNIYLDLLHHKTHVEKVRHEQPE